MTLLPLTTVVIPTIRRPVEVLRAIDSVLRQTNPNLELLVIVDGQDAPTFAALKTVCDSRLRVLGLPENLGIARVRNKGIAEARGTWVAFLDDDDEWLPTKLELQVNAAMKLGGDRVVVAGHFIDRGKVFEREMPYRDPEPGEPITEYMFCRKGLLSRAGHLQTSTYFISKLLAEEVLFRPEIRPQEDFDFLIRCALRADRPVHLVREPLSIYHNEQTANREGALGEFEFFWSYVHRNRELFTPESFSSYLATYCAPLVKLAADPWQRWLQVYRGMKQGKLTLRTLIFAILFALFPFETRRRMRLFVSSLVPSRARVPNNT